MRRAAAVLVLGALVCGGCVGAGTDPPGRPPSGNTGSSTDPIARACALDDDVLVRLWRGHDAVRSEDVTVVPREPNFIGTFDLTSHSGPWDYLQRVPLVLYGPGFVAARATPVERPVALTDVYPTIGRLIGVDLPSRDGRVLREAIVRAPRRVPRLVVVVVWDGAGRNTLVRWPDEWPTLRRLTNDGTSYANATVGSSPSVTSAIHSTLGTGAWPRRHGVTGNDIRTRGGDLDLAFAGSGPDALRLATFADEIDAALHNEPKVGLLAWRPWHIGMMGHGLQFPGGDADELALLKYDDGVTVFGNPTTYSIPGYLAGADVSDDIARVDRSDGALDGEWLGHDITLENGVSWTTYSNPAWAGLETDVALRMLARGSYGRDRVPDFFFVNYKMTDLAGHQWSIDSPEMASVLHAQDEGLGRIVEYLDENVQDYALVLTADHGHARSPAVTGAWPIVQDQLIADLDAHFGVPNGSSLIEASAAFGYFLDEQIAVESDVEAADVASFLAGYTIADNWDAAELPEGYGGREAERVFDAAFAKEQLDEVMSCAFGSPRPPSDVGA